jgi:hypothetical protein
MAASRTVNVATQPTDRWWPVELGTPATYGSTEHLRYASFPGVCRLAIYAGGACNIYDTGDYQFRGVLQGRGSDGALSFLTQFGRIELARLALVR